MMKGVNVDPEDPNYDLWQKACKICAKRFYPNFVNVDSSFNRKYVKYDRVEADDYDYIVRNKITNEKKTMSETEIKNLKNKQQYAICYNGIYYDIDE